MPLPPLHDWQNTSRALHHTVLLLEPLSSLLVNRQPNAQHLTVSVTPDGIETQHFHDGAQVRVDFTRGTLTYHMADGQSMAFDITLHTQASLFAALLSAMRGATLSELLQGVEMGGEAYAVIDRLNTTTRKNAPLSLGDYTRSAPLTFNIQTARDYAAVQYAAFTGLARFKARIVGAMTRANVWPHNFDMSSLWFPPSNVGMDERGAHLAFGFAPYTSGQYDQPYLYAYAYPYPDGFSVPALPEPAFWHDNRWRGVVVRYAELAAYPHPEAAIEALYLRIFDTLRPLVSA